MNFEQIKVADDYAEWTDTTAKYPVTAETSYLALGIADECGELADVLFPEQALKEGGDVLWYAARYCRRVLNISFSSVVDRLQFYSLCPTYPQIIKDIGMIAGVEKKRIRDGANWDEDTRANKHVLATQAVIRLVKWVNQVLLTHGYSLYDAMLANQGKLNKRLEDGTIQGDGDNR